MKRKREVVIGASLIALIVALGVGQSALDKVAAAQSGVEAPMFEVDPFWPKPLPNNWVLGNAIGVWVDDQDHIWILVFTGSRPGHGPAVSERARRRFVARRRLVLPSRCHVGVPSAAR